MYYTPQTRTDSAGLYDRKVYTSYIQLTYKYFKKQRRPCPLELTLNLVNNGSGPVNTLKYGAPQYRKTHCPICVQNLLTLLPNTKQITGYRIVSKNRPYRWMLQDLICTNSTQDIRWLQRSWCASASRSKNPVNPNSDSYGIISPHRLYNKMVIFVDLHKKYYCVQVNSRTVLIYSCRSAPSVTSQEGGNTNIKRGACRVRVEFLIHTLIVTLSWAKRGPAWKLQLRKGPQTKGQIVADMSSYLHFWNISLLILLQSSLQMKGLSGYWVHYP